MTGPADNGGPNERIAAQPSAGPGGDALLAVEDLEVSFVTEEGVVHAVDHASLSLQEGEVLAIVGESGCGKSVTAMSIVGLTRGPNSRISGSVRYRGRELLSAGDEELRKVRGAGIAMIFQDPMSSFNPVHRIGDQIVEAITVHQQLEKGEARRKAIEALGAVGIPQPEERFRGYPHEYSGGMRQRAMIAMALALEPAVLIADEPSTALDVTIQAQIIELLRQLNRERGLAVILITHDLGVVADIADRIAVMYAGRVVEQGTLDQIFYDPQHPYTWGLLGSLTPLNRPPSERLPQISGAPPSLLSPPEGCHFRPRCPHSFAKCVEVPGLEARLPDSSGHLDRCWLSPDEKAEKRRVGDRIGLEAPAP